MIITKKWLNEWIDIRDIDTDKICLIFNSIGLEVDSVKEVRMPQNVVVGRVEEKIKHPDADKLSICQVDVGGDIKQIVCGASNVKAKQFVAVALEGAKLPNGLKIKSSKLRGVESNGMICSSTELGLPFINDGIMVLDESLGEIKVGMALSDIDCLNDDVIELELTPNRGDCLSVHGIARDLSAALGLALKKFDKYEEDDKLLGIGRVFSLHSDEKNKSSFIYTICDIKKLKKTLIYDLRLSLINANSTSMVEKILNYVTHSTGVLLRAYDYESLEKTSDDKTRISIKYEKDGKIAVYSSDKCLSYAGILQNDVCRITENSKKIILEASYTRPEDIANIVAHSNNLKTDDHFYRSFRGSEPNLEFGMEYLQIILSNEKCAELFAGKEQILPNNERKIVNFAVEDLNKMLGQEVSKEKIVQILQNLNFEVVLNSDQNTINAKIPHYRHDIENSNDICEEVVRMIGIDNIQSIPLKFYENSKLNNSYLNFKKRSSLRKKAAGIGFYESIHYIFTDSSYLQMLDLPRVNKELEISNPISSELNCLRTSLLPNLLQSAQRNSLVGKKSIPLFEIGTVFDEKRNEKTNMAFIFSGYEEEISILNNAKPKSINFMTFLKKVKEVVGNFEIIQSDDISSFLNPYEQADILIDGKKVGLISRVHKKIENYFNLDKTYVCEIEFDAIDYSRKIAHKYSKLQVSSRDLSLLVPKDVRYSQIRTLISTLNVKNLLKFYPIDKYRDENLGSKTSLTVRFEFQGKTENLEDEIIKSLMDKILNNLKSELNIEIR